MQRQQINIINIVKGNAPYGAPFSLFQDKSPLLLGLLSRSFTFFICKLAVTKPALGYYGEQPHSTVTL